MEVHKCLQVNIRNTLSIREVEVLAVKIRSYALEPSAGHGFRPRVNERHFPWLASILMNLHLILCDIKGHLTCLEIALLTDPGSHASCKNHGLPFCSLPLRWQRSLLLRCLAFVSRAIG